MKIQTMKIILFTAVCVVAGWAQIQAQELPLFTQYREFQSFINPAALPVDYLSQTYQPTQTAGISYRNQWINYDGGPTTMTARYEFIAEDWNSVFGGNLVHDKTGRFSRSGAFLRYAYDIEFTRTSKLTIGAKFGAYQNKYDSKDGVLQDPGDLTGETNVNQIIPDFGVGAFYMQEFYNDDIFYAGVSVPQFGNSLGSSSGNRKPEFLYEATHLFINAGFYKKLNLESNFGSRSMFVEPSLWIKYVEAAPLQTDLNMRVHFPDALWVGIGYGLSFEEKLQGNFLHFEGGVVIDEVFGLYDKDIKIGFGYDNIFGNLGYGGFGNSFEVNVSFSWL
ncbi:MAG: type IX secretion system membrane protein PorP/SprF [Bacteroidetes bacterium]|nr:MAG: type IX secretion system membrane protein PorP/SprF [Bacteroidota bacterium]